MTDFNYDFALGFLKEAMEKGLSSEEAQAALKKVAENLNKSAKAVEEAVETIDKVAQIPDGLKSKPGITELYKHAELNLYCYFEKVGQVEKAFQYYPSINKVAVQKSTPDILRNAFARKSSGWKKLK